MKDGGKSLAQVLALCLMAGIFAAFMLSRAKERPVSELSVVIPEKDAFMEVRRVNLFIDPKNGCQYISPADTSPFTPRLDVDGRQVCGDQSEIK